MLSTRSSVQTHRGTPLRGGVGPLALRPRNAIVYANAPHTGMDYHAGDQGKNSRERDIDPHFLSSLLLPQLTRDLSTQAPLPQQPSQQQHQQLRATQELQRQCRPLCLAHMHSTPSSRWLCLSLPSSSLAASTAWLTHTPVCKPRAHQTTCCFQPTNCTIPMQLQGMPPRPEYYVAAPPGPPMYPAQPMYQQAPAAAGSSIPWWVWMGAGFLAANVARMVQEFMKKGPQQMMAEMVRSGAGLG